MPLDEYRIVGNNTVTYAEQLAVRPCVESAGFEWPVPWQEIDVPPTPTMSKFGARLFDEEIAARWGYHPGTFDTESTRLWQDFIAASRRIQETPGFQESFDECVKNLRVEYPWPDIDDQMVISQYYAQSMERAAQAPEVVEASKRWRECMTPLGVADLPATRAQMPTPDLARKFGLTPFGLPDVAAGGDVEPSAEEVEIAVADATCAEESGYSESLYQAQWRLQQEILSTERTKLDRIRDQIEKQHEDALRIIAENAPDAP